METIISVRDLYKLYRVGDSVVRALDGISLDIREGEFCAVVGTSGSGKSTLLNMLAGLERPTKGEVVIGGSHIEKMNEDQLVRFRRENVGFIFQSFHLMATMNALENVAIPLTLRGTPRKERMKRADRMLDRVSLSKHKNHLPNQMSGGQQQRVGIARALAASPDILLMDEPFGAVDETTRGQLQKEIRRIHGETKVTVVFVTHDIYEARYLGTKVLVMDKGNIQQYDTPENLEKFPANPFVEELLKGSDKRRA